MRKHKAALMGGMFRCYRSDFEAIGRFDEFGDWYFVKNKKPTKAIFTGKDREAADSFYYDVKR